MAGRKKRGQKNQSNQQKGTTTRARKNIAHVVKEHVEEFSDGNSSDDLSAPSEVKYYFGIS
ncbi:unnamed protein product [Brassica rapa]|uniref:Uncharacterized protein n=1 Tax=Brassica campestris TaxID=3711 RepID=A0A8D9LT79_BRACM|nr:unnamed protein product [Brassica rapa]